MRGTTTGRRRRLAWAAGALATVVPAAGCAAMPDSGPVSKVELSQGAADKNLQVRVFPVAPAKGAGPRELLAGFLDASTADGGYETAKLYLTEKAGKTWNPEESIVVLAANPTTRSGTAPGEADTALRIPVSGAVVAEVDAKHTYRLADGSREFTFEFVKEKSGEWRIDDLPNGLIINETNFRNSYRQADRFFYAAADPSLPGAREVLVADPVYLRRRIDPLTAAAKALVAGPSDWLAPVVSSSFTATAVERVTVDEGRTAEVVISGTDLSGRDWLCNRMANQLFHTLNDQGKGQIDRLRLKGPGKECQVTRSDARTVGPGALAADPASQPVYQQYYQRTDTGQLMVAREQGDGTPVAGVLGKELADRQHPLGQVAVRRDGKQAAAIGADGNRLYSVGLTEADRQLGEPVLTLPARPGDKPEDGLASPSWDGRDNLWVLDRDPQTPRVLMVRGRKVVNVPVEGLAGWRVQSLKVASDGTRIALVLKDPAGAQKLVLGRIVHGGSEETPSAQITGLRAVAPLLSEVSSVSWADSDQLLVLGREKERLQQLHYIGTDGSQDGDGPLHVADSMAVVSASEYREESLASVPSVLAVTADGGRIYRLTNNQWRDVGMPGKALWFGYPG
ncbi:LpqB family beta-propeller domain-containing protein [Kitasatospora sp. NPDC054939]